MIIVNSLVNGTKCHLPESLRRYFKTNFKTRTHDGFHAFRRKTHTVPKGGPWNVLFFGTDGFAVESLSGLHNCRSNLLRRLEVVTVKKNLENAVERYAKKHGIATHTWPLQFQIRDFDIGMINVHGSLLPRWRGAAPIIYSLMNGDQRTGITIMKIMPKKFDVGAIVAQREVQIDPHEKLPELRVKLAKLGADLLTETVKGLPGVLQSARSQDDTLVTYAPKVKPSLSLINWNEMTARNVYDLQRALFGLYPLTTMFQDVKIKLLNVNETEKPAGRTSQEIPGVVVFGKRSNALFVKCAQDSWVSVETVIMPNRATMSARDFNNGFIAGKNKTETYFH